MSLLAAPEIMLKEPVGGRSYAVLESEPTAMCTALYPFRLCMVVS